MSRVDSHRLLRMSGRDPHELHRVATPLELLFDLTFVVAFSAAGNELAHALAEGHAASGLIGFVSPWWASGGARCARIPSTGTAPGSTSSR